MRKISADFKGAKALVVDDYFINQELIKEMMQLMNCKVDVADDGTQTMDKYRQNNYDIIMLDVQMPEIDGYEVTKQIRQIEATGTRPRTIIVALTANALPDDEKKCLDAGMDDYISKPLRGEQLEDMLTKHLIKTA